MWDWLINCSVDDVLALPCPVRSNEEWLSLPVGPRFVIYLHASYGGCRLGRTLAKDYLEFVNTGVMSKAIAAHRGRRRMWVEHFRDQLVRQKPLIADWTITQSSCADIPLRDAHWHVDPPYQGKPGRGYRHNEIDFDHLGDWCWELPGAVDVCEERGSGLAPVRGSVFVQDDQRKAQVDGGGLAIRSRARSLQGGGVMSILQAAWKWIAAGAAALIAALLIIVRFQSNRIERKDEEIRTLHGWVGTTRRINAAPKARTPEEARAWLEDHGK